MLEPQWEAETIGPASALSDTGGSAAMTAGLLAAGPAPGRAGVWSDLAVWRADWGLRRHRVLVLAPCLRIAVPKLVQRAVALARRRWWAPSASDCQRPAGLGADSPKGFAEQVF